MLGDSLWLELNPALAGSHVEISAVSMLLTVFDLISEHALISEHPLFFSPEILNFFFFFFYSRASL